MYSMDEGYTSTLSIAPEGKFPVRRGNSTDPELLSQKLGVNCQLVLIEKLL